MDKNQYDITKPRYTVKNKLRAFQDCYYHGFESLSANEVVFWITLGYIVEEYRWNGSHFALLIIHNI
jgi:hypothetical protein